MKEMLKKIGMCNDCHQLITYTNEPQMKKWPATFPNNFLVIRGAISCQDACKTFFFFYSFLVIPSSSV